MYKERRKKLLAQLPDWSLTVFVAGQPSRGIGDEMVPFTPQRTFYYLTGLQREKLVLLLVKNPTVTQEILFIEPFDPVMAKWVGGKILPEEAKAISEIEDIRYLSTLERTLFGYINSNAKKQQYTLCGELSKMELEQPWPVADLFAKLQKGMPDVTITNISQITTRMRNIKEDAEIEQMKKAIEITNEGIKAMMKASHDGIWENELEAHFDFELKCRQAGHAFHTICATGKRATILHYGSNNQQSGEGELCLIDLGASHNLYCADISRTFPINGKFTERQKEVYEVVLRANKLFQKKAKPGVTLRELNNEIIKFYEKELPKIGLTTDGKTVRDYYYHSVSHHLGLETHDVAIMDEPLKAGCVVTDEPGLYIEEEGIGIRIEDDILITRTGCVCLSADIIKEVADIEAFMQG